ncbi:MAG: Peptidase M23 [Chloroflexi bacterium]|nr:MAG: Peptidase M23 [Chloroflexota bacterium]MBA4375214.1 hypothetical protein [Anaerolinea sp.]
MRSILAFKLLSLECRIPFQRISLILLSLILLSAGLLFPINTITAQATTFEQTRTLTPTPAALVPTDNLPDQPDFPAVTVKPDLDWRPPLYEAPLALNLRDHFYFVRPIAVDSINWPLPDYRYGYIFPDEDIAHTGIDIVSPLHKPVLAAAEGKVVFTGYGLLNGGGDIDDPYGLTVVIRHTFSFDSYTIYSVYAHLDRIDVKTGQWLKTGNQVGIIGMTGKTSGPHLHFEIRIENENGDKVQNPELWLVPPIGYGVIAGRIVNNYGTLLTAKKVWLASLETGVVWTIFTYAPKTKQVDDYYRENFAIGDLPAGNYEISMYYNGKMYRGPVVISPGAVNYIQFNGINGFVQKSPATPHPTEFLQ